MEAEEQRKTGNTYRVKNKKWDRLGNGHMEKQEMEMKRKLEMETGNRNQKLKAEMEMQLLRSCSLLARFNGCYPSSLPASSFWFASLASQASFPDLL